MDQSYWDLSSILADASRLPCHAALDVPGLAHLQGMEGAEAAAAAAAAADAKESLRASTLKKSTRVDIPFWLAELLGLHGAVDLGVPASYSARVRNALDAQATSVRLRDLSAWWYAVGTRLCALMDADDLDAVLQRTYAARLALIYSSGQHLAASAQMHGAGEASHDALSALNDNLDSLGGTAAISMSQEMSEFLQGLEESESQREWGGKQA